MNNDINEKALITGYDVDNRNTILLNSILLFMRCIFILKSQQFNSVIMFLDFKSDLIDKLKYLGKRKQFIKLFEEMFARLNKF